MFAGVYLCIEVFTVTFLPHRSAHSWFFLLNFGPKLTFKEDDMRISEEEFAKIPKDYSLWSESVSADT